MKIILLRLSKILFLFIALAIILIAIAFAVLKTSSPILGKYQSKIIARVNNLSPYQFSVEHVEVSWYHFSPVILFHHATIAEKSDLAHPIAEMQDVYIGMSLLALLHHQFMPNRVIIDEGILTLPETVLKTLQQGEHNPEQNLQLLQKYLTFLAPFKEIGAKNLIIALTSNQKTITRIHTNLLLNHTHQGYRFQASLSMENNPVNATIIIRMKPNFSDLLNSNIKVYLDLAHLDIAHVAQFLQQPLPYSLSGNIKHLNLLVHYAKHAFDSVAVDTTVKNVNFKTEWVKTIHTLPNLSTNFIYSQKKDRKELAINRFTLDEKSEGASGLIYLFAGKDPITVETHNVPSTVMSSKDDKARDVEIALENLSLDTSMLKQYILILNEPIQKKWETFAPMLKIAKMRADLLLRDNQINIQKVAIDIHHLHVKPVENFPGCTDLYAKVLYTPTAGKAFLTFPHTVIKMPWLFRKPISILEGHSIITWEEEAHRWQIKMPYADLRIPQGKIQAGMSLFIGDEKPVRLELIGKVDLDGLTQEAIAGYMPIAVIPKDVLAWLDNSLQQVGQSQATLLLRGNMDDFPFDKQEGLFLIQGEAREAAIKFYPGWPVLTNVVANLLFRDRKMLIEADAGVTEGLNINHLWAEIPSMGGTIPTVLDIDAKGSGEIPQGLSYIRHSPLGKGIILLDDIHSTGDLDLTLGLLIPLTNAETEAVQSKGTIILHDGVFSYSNIPLSLSQVNGKIDFVNTRLESNTITGYLGKKPVSFNIVPVIINKNTYASAVNLQGYFALEDINRYLPEKLPSFLSGSTEMKATFLFNPADSNSFQVKSNLKGVAVNLPQPLGKKASESSSFSLTIKEIGQRALECLLSYKEKFLVHLMITKDKHYQLTSGTVTLGETPAPSMPSQGLSIVAKLTNVELNPWLAFYQKNKTESTNIAHLPLNEFKVLLDNITVMGQTLQNFSVIFTPGQTQSIVAIQSAEAVGNITLPARIDASHPIIADFSRLRLKAGKDIVTSHPVVNPYYNVNFRCSRCQFNQYNLGSVSANVRVTGNQGLMVNNLLVGTSNYQISGSGNWVTLDNTTTLNVRVNSKNLSNMLIDLGLPGSISSNRATGVFSLRWKGFPTAFDSALLQGNINLNIQEGYIESANKSTSAKIGLGNLMTALNLQNLSSRFSQGMQGSRAGYEKFYFKNIQGDFTVTNGVLETQNMVINGRIAFVSIKGKIGLPQQNYDLVVTVIPNITSSLPVIATIAGGPLAGVATWAIDKAVGQQVNKITKYTYTVRGNFGSPTVVEQK